MKEKLIKLLDVHGIVYIESEDNIYCFIYANSKEYDILSIVDGVVYCNDKPTSIFEWLGY